jgi:hypothetical protein
MRRLLVTLAVGSVVFAHAKPAHAARITDVADAADQKQDGLDPIDIHVELGFDLLRHTALITRENTQPPPNDPNGTPRTADVKELEWERVRTRLKPRLEVGIFHDLAVFTEWPIVISDTQTTKFAEGTTAGNSTIVRDMAPNAAPGVDGWSETEGAGNANASIQDGKYGFPGKPYNAWAVGTDGTFAGSRAGLDNPVFGLRYSPLNNERDETKPTTTLQVDYTAPFFAQMNPTNDAITDGNVGAVTDGLHKFHFSIAMSKRWAVFDPYFQIDYTIPFVGNEVPDVLGHQPRQFGGFLSGVEIVPYEDAKLKQRFAIDLQASATYFSEGRDYSEVSDLFREMTYTDQYVRLGGQAGLKYTGFGIFFIDVSGQFGYDTEHFLTIEDFGKDLGDANNEIDLDDVAERNPYYNPVLDTVGRRLRIEQSVQLGVLARVGITF